MANRRHAVSQQERLNRGARSLATGLGWFSIGLGIAEVAMGRRLTRSLGMEGETGLVRLYGLREIATGLGILAAKDPTPWIWGRVAGDAVDLATLAAGLTRRNPERDRVGLAIGMVGAVTALDVICAQALSSSKQERPRAPVRDYSGRSGFPKPPEQMRGAASDFEAPPDFRIPNPLRPYGT